MLTLILSGLVAHRGTDSVGVFLRKHGFTQRTSRNLSHDGATKQLRDSTVQQLCEALCCTPNSLFLWTGDPSSHLAKLKKGYFENPADQLAWMGQADVERVLKEVEGLVGGMEKQSVGGTGRLRLNVRRLIEQRQQPHPMVYLERMGFTRTQAQILLDPERKAFRLRVLTQLCERFECLPDDLFDWEGSEGHFLNVLRKTPSIDLSVSLKGLSSADAARVVVKLGARS